MKHPRLSVVPVILIVIVIVSTALHLWRIAEPARPVFDEAHFATYAADYVKGQPFLDIHPPLGKLIYAGVLSLAARGEPLGRTDFVGLRRDTRSNEFETVDNHLPYGNYPYVALRIVSAFFGVLLPILFYWFLRSIGVGTLGSLLGAALVSLENAFLLETRLILLDGMYLAFGLAALAAYLTYRSSRYGAWLAGLAWGLSLGVKLTAAVFLGPVLVPLILARGRESRLTEKRSIARFAGAGLLVLAAIVLAQNAFFSGQARLTTWQSIGVAPDVLPSETQIAIRENTPLTYLSASLLESLVSVVGYVGSPQNTFPHEFASKWYLWPAMHTPVPYAYTETGSIARPLLTLKGNPFVWFGATFAVIVALAVLPRYLRRHWRAGWSHVAEKPLFVLLGGYIGSLLPFIFIVKRSTFLYHYFPAYLFAIGLLAWGVERAFSLPFLASHPVLRSMLIALAGVGVVSGFVLAAPFTYGF